MRLYSAGKLAPAFLMMILIVPLSIHCQAGAAAILQPADLQNLFPATVFYRGQTAPAQIRNSSGVKFAGGFYVLASLVDTSGYSSGAVQKYQGYLITEVPLAIGGKHLAAGAYGFGFIAGNRFVVTDLGGHAVLSATFATDNAMKRPRPLQITSDPAGGYRLYAGRSYVRWAR